MLDKLKPLLVLTILLMGATGVAFAADGHLPGIGSDDVTAVAVDDSANASALEYGDEDGHEDAADDQYGPEDPAETPGEDEESPGDDQYGPEDESNADDMSTGDGASDDDNGSGGSLDDASVTYDDSASAESRDNDSASADSPSVDSGSGSGGGQDRQNHGQRVREVARDNHGQDNRSESD